MRERYKSKQSAVPKEPWPNRTFWKKYRSLSLGGTVATWASQPGSWPSGLRDEQGQAGKASPDKVRSDQVEAKFVQSRHGQV